MTDWWLTPLSGSAEHTIAPWAMWHARCMVLAWGVLRESGGHWHDYGKESRAGRKVGHATLRADSIGELADALERVGVALEREAQVKPVMVALR